MAKKIIKNKTNKLRYLWYIPLFAGAIYLLNPTAGIFELIPDNIPIIGNLDEAGAVLLIQRALIGLNG